MIRLLKTALIILVIAFMIVLAMALLPPDTKSKPVGAAAPAFDHSNCQYPDRWSNPADGCDNSDPAVPECIKGMATQEAEAACIAAFVEQHKAAEQPAAPVEQVSSVTPAAEPAACGGK